MLRRICKPKFVLFLLHILGVVDARIQFVRLHHSIECVMDVTFPTSCIRTGIRTQTKELLRLPPLPLGYTDSALGRLFETTNPS